MTEKGDKDCILPAADLLRAAQVFLEGWLQGNMVGSVLVMRLEAPKANMMSHDFF